MYIHVIKEETLEEKHECEGMTINFEEEIEHFKPSLEVEEVGEAIVKSDLTDMSDIMMELLKHMKE